MNDEQHDPDTAMERFEDFARFDQASRAWDTNCGVRLAMGSARGVCCLFYRMA
jgi:hypothetical protein